MFAWPIKLWPLALETDMTSIDQLEFQRSHVYLNCLERIGNYHSMPCVQNTKSKTLSLCPFGISITTLRPSYSTHSIDLCTLPLSYNSCKQAFMGSSLSLGGKAAQKGWYVNQASKNESLSFLELGLLLNISHLHCLCWSTSNLLNLAENFCQIFQDGPL